MAQIDQIEVTQGDKDAVADFYKVSAEIMPETDFSLSKAWQAFALHRIASEEAAVLRGVKAGLEAAAEAFRCEAITWEQLGPRQSACVRQGVKSILALDPQAIAKDATDAD